ncbi:MAG: hypothetical protein OXU32_05390 [Gammaproteobacteria bacterium]|nr:hypothetical protein [Gammaproteobacteria bacterium]
MKNRIVWVVYVADEKGAGVRKLLPALGNRFALCIVAPMDFGPFDEQVLPKVLPTKHLMVALEILALYGQ